MPDPHDSAGADAAPDRERGGMPAQSAAGGGLRPAQILFPLVQRLAKALALGIAGGWVFSRLGIPLPWMLGPVCFTLLAALGGVTMQVPNRFRDGMLLILGVLIGSGFTPDIVAHLHRWAASISLVLVYTVLLTLLAGWFYRRVVGYDRANAFFAGLPGGLAAVIFIGAEAGADLRTLSIVHSIRIVTVCFAIPMWLTFVTGVAAATRTRSLFEAINAGDALILAGCALGGYWLARRLRLAAPFLLGPLLLSAAVHLSGLTAATPPGILVIAAQVVVGSAIGCRFVGISLRRVLGTVGVGSVAAVLMVLTAFAMASVVHRLTGLPYNAVLLALAPGGLPEMTLIALSLEVDLALVVSHHLIRVLFINVGVPLIYRLWVVARPQPAPNDPPM